MFSVSLYLQIVLCTFHCFWSLCRAVLCWESLSLLYFSPDFANFNDNNSLRSVSDSIFRVINAFSYEMYFSLSTILQKDFCVLSKSSVFSCVSELCHTTLDCSKILRQKTIQRCTISSCEAPKLRIFRNNSETDCTPWMNTITLHLVTPRQLNWYQLGELNLVTTRNMNA